MKTQIELMETVDNVSRHAPEREVRDASLVPVGKCCRQGDIYLARVEVCSGKVLTRKQLVDGVSRGSRHVLEGDATLHEPDRSQMPSYVDSHALLLPSVVVGGGGAVLTHPEHALFSLPANSRWVAWQQMDPRTRDRVID